MKPGRNNPCPCGSGKKYKHCCLASDPAGAVNLADQTWQRMRDALGGYGAELQRFTKSVYGENAIEQAWFEFTFGESTEPDADDPNLGLFFPWFFHRWTPQSTKGNEIADKSAEGMPPTRAYLARRGRQLNPLVHRYLEACLASTFSFHEILDCEPTSGFTARDVFTGAEHYVRDKASSSILDRGDILFGQLVHVQGITMLEGAAPFAFPPVFKTHLVQVRHEPQLQSHPELALRRLYFDLADTYLNPRAPQLHNTDGELIEPRTLYFEIDSPQQAFDALKSLELGASEDELRSEAKFNSTGAVVEAHISWTRKANPTHPAMETVLLGRLHINGNKLTAEVNSAERARALRALITKTLGPAARYKRARKQPVDAALPPRSASGPGSGIPKLHPRDAEQEALMQLPEVQAQLAAFHRKHYETWPDIPLPALNGRTPLEAVKNVDGRDMVAALITQFERDARRMEHAPDPQIFKDLRRKLGL
jgi:hypothetical protein